MKYRKVKGGIPMAVLGCIADDFTGASDAASFLVKGGMSVRLYNGIPDQPALEKGPDRHLSLIHISDECTEVCHRCTWYHYGCNCIDQN